MPVSLQTCLHCGVTSEPNFHLVGNVLCINCGSCHAHVKYFPRITSERFPSIDRIKYYIFITAEGNLSKINTAKLKINFRLFNTPLYNQLEYYRLYKHLRNEN